MSEGGTALRELLASFGFRWDERAVTRADQGIGQLLGTAARFGRMMIAGVAASGAARWAQQMIEVGSELHDTSEATGLSATELTEWRYAARLSGVEAGALSTSMARVAVMAQRAPQEFHRLGVQVRDSNGQMRHAADIFEDTGVAIGALTNDTQRTARATQFFGRSGRALLPLFRQGRAGIQGLRQEVRRLYGTDLERLAEQSDRAGDAQDRLNLVWDALSTRLAVTVLPYLTQFLEWAVTTSGELAEMVQHSSAVQAALVVLGGIAVGVALATMGAWGPPLLLFGLVAAAIFVVVGFVDDLITLFRGGHSVIGEFIDELFGVGTAADWVHGLTEAWEGLTLAMHDASEAVADFFGASDPSQMPRATTRGAGPASEGITAAEDARRSAIARASRGEHIPYEEARRLFGHGSGSVDAAAGGSGSVSITRTTHVGAIHVDGAGDPVVAARLTRDAIEDAGASADDDTGHDLVPATGAG